MSLFDIYQMVKMIMNDMTMRIIKNYLLTEGTSFQTWQNYMEQAGQLMSNIKTYDQETYDIQVEGDRIKIRKNNNVTG